jgi:hypothetical protein
MSPISPRPSTYRDLAAVGRADRLQRPARVDAFDDVAGWQDLGAVPVVRVAHVHELDEAQGMAAFAEMLRQRDDLVVVHAALHHGVDLDRQPDLLCRRDARQHAVHRKTQAVHPARDHRIQRIQRHAHAVQSCLPQRRGALRQQPAIRRQRHVPHAQFRLQHAHQLRQIGAQQRLSAGEAHFLHPQRDERPRDLRHFVEGHQLRVPEKRIARAEDFLGHAVRTAEVTPVRHRDPEISEGALMAVDGAGGHAQESETANRST